MVQDVSYSSSPRLVFVAPLYQGSVIANVTNWWPFRLPSGDRFSARGIDLAPGGTRGTPNPPKRSSESDFDSLAILKDKLAHEWRQRLEQALAARFDQVECLLVVARRAAIGIGDVHGGACGAEAGEH